MMVSRVGFTAYWYLFLDSSTIQDGMQNSLPGLASMEDIFTWIGFVQA